MSVPDGVENVVVEMEFKHKLTGDIVLRDDPTDPERQPKKPRPVTQSGE